MENLGRAVGIDVQLKDRRALGTEGSFVVWATRVALDIDDLAVDGVDQRAASDGAIGADAGSDLGAFDPQLLCPRNSRSEIDARANLVRSAR